LLSLKVRDDEFASEENERSIQMPDDSTLTTAKIHFRMYKDKNDHDRREDVAIKNEVNLIMKQKRRLLYVPIILAGLFITTLATAQHMPQSPNHGETTDGDSSDKKRFHCENSD
jgi:hypothetical protein